ncbi:MAG: ubiquinol-cytochrome c reductase cytochrome c subunit [Actinomycetota bacterium]|jgi:ubiquinol-cytochrome c reductase cytochrome c subunit|nr:ubiquinol-cytochrome c reductase cytochrome c subunit [Actinomycetota bacterium]
MSSTSEEPVVALSSLATAARRPTTRRRRRLAGYAVLVIALLGVGSAYGLLAARTGVAAVGDPSQQVRSGKALYLQGCSSCHGLAAGGGGGVPSLIGVGAAAVDFQVSTGRMPLKQIDAQAVRKPSSYTSAEIAELAAYVASLGPGPAVPDKGQYTPTDANMALGGNLFRTNCSSCHNFTGEGGALAYGKFAPSLSKSTDQQIYEAMLSGPGTMPVFGDKQLTPTQKKDIIAYVQGMKATPDPGGANLGRAGAVAEGLVAWLAGVAVLAGVAMWIGARARRAA